jgi:hypothetical protein
VTQLPKPLTASQFTVSDAKVVAAINQMLAYLREREAVPALTPAPAIVPAPKLTEIDVRELDGSKVIDDAIAQVTNPETGIAGENTLPRGPLVITRPVPIKGLRGLRLKGQGEWATVLNLRLQDPRQSAFVLQDSRDIKISALGIVADQPHSAVGTMERTVEGPGTNTPTDYAWEDIWVDLRSKGDYGFRQLATIDANNEHARYTRVRVHGHREWAWDIGHRQAKENSFLNCTFSGFATSNSKGGVRASGSFSWMGGAGSGVETAFSLGEPADIISITGGPGGFEACGRLLDVARDRTTAPWTVSLFAVSYRADAMIGDHAIRLRCPGSLNLFGCELGSGKMPRIPRILVDTFGRASINLIGNQFSAFGAHLVNPLDVRPGVTPAVLWGANNYSTGGEDNVITVVGRPPVPWP